MMQNHNNVFHLDPETLVDENNTAVEEPRIRINQASVEESVREILVDIGEDPEREGLLKTPNRVARMYDELTAGYHIDPEKLVNDAVFNVDYDEMVVVKDIDFFSMCEHHMLPF